MAVNTSAPRFQPLPSSVTATVLAHAVVAAARFYEDDPVKAMTSAMANDRRALTAAVSGVADAAEVTPRRIAPLLGVSVHTVEQRRRTGGGQFHKAAAAAHRAAKAEMDRATPPLPRPAPAERVPLTAYAEGGALTERIVRALGDKGACSPMTLAFLVEAKELRVGQALTQLEQEGRVLSDAMPFAGRRAQLWRLPPSEGGDA
jgi:hypothetical protein